MGGKTKATLFAMAVLSIVLAVAAVATAATRVGFTVTPSTVRYGQEVTMTPSIDATAVPGDKFDVQVFNTSTSAWEKWGEGLAVEETITPDAEGVVRPDPLLVIIDESLSYPAILRAVYLPKSSSVPSMASDPTVLTVKRNGATKISAKVPRSAKKGKAFAVTAVVAPNCGVGNVKVTIKRIGGSARSTVIQTDADGIAEGEITIKSAGRYALTFKFAGSKFGGASKATTKYLSVR